MKSPGVVNACFIASATNLQERPSPALPEFAFIGRSNCGKSSLINHYLGQSRLAKTSGKPGKTRSLNYYLVDDRYYVVDLPGYGYARVSKRWRRAYSELIRGYLSAGDRPLAVFHLLDVRRRPSPEDAELSSWLLAADLPVAIALTKSDKVGRGNLQARCREIITVLGLPGDLPFFPTSAHKGMGRKEMQAWVEAVLTSAVRDS